MYKQDITNCYVEYKNARQKRREMFGPTLTDLAEDIMKVTYKELRSKTVILREKFSVDNIKEMLNTNLDKLKERLKVEQKPISNIKTLRHNPCSNEDLLIDELDALKNEEEILDKVYLKHRRLNKLRGRYYNEVQNLTDTPVNTQKPKDDKKNNKVEMDEDDVELAKQRQLDELYALEEARQQQEQMETDDDKKKAKKEFAKLYYEGGSSIINDGLNNNNVYSDIIFSAENSALAETFGNFGASVSVFWKTLRESKPLVKYEMLDIVSDVDEINSLDERLVALEKDRKELLLQKESLENKYDLVSDKERTDLAYLRMLQASTDYLDYQYAYAYDNGLDVDIIERNKIETISEYERVSERLNNKNPFDLNSYELDKPKLIVEDNENLEESYFDDAELDEYIEQYEKMKKDGAFVM